jgi:DNA polymerase
MIEAATMIPTGALASVLNWWQDAGVDMLVDEVPTPWLARSNAAAEPTLKPVSGRPTPAIVPAATALPSSIEAFIAWFSGTGEVPGTGPAEARLAPCGNPEASFMTLIDMPEAGDAAQGRLLSGEAGALFDGMLKALKLDRDSIWLSSLLPDFRLTSPQTRAWPKSPSITSA